MTRPGWGLGLLLGLALLAGAVTAPAMAGEGPVAVEGRVVDGRGGPLQASVRLAPIPLVERAWRRRLLGQPPVAPLVESTTDADGLFRVEAPAAGMWRLLVLAEGRPAVEVDLVPLFAATVLAPIELPPIEQPPERSANALSATDVEPPGRPAKGSGAVQRLRVSDASGRPAAGALAWLLADPTRPIGVADADGVLELVPAGKDLSREPVAIVHEGARAVVVPRFAEEPISLRGAASISGSVTDGSGRALAGSVVWPENDPGNAVWTDATGRFRLTGLVAEEAVQVLAAAPGRGPRLFVLDPLRAGGESGPLELRLEHGFPCNGRVVGPGQQPIVGAQVRLTPSAVESTAGSSAESAAESGPGPRPLYRAETAEGGWFSLQALAPGRYDLHVESPGHASLTVPAITVSSPPSGQPGALGTVILEPAVSLSGRVVDPQGTPVAGARIGYLLAADRDRWVVADPEGGFEISGLRVGERITLRVIARGYAEARLTALVTASGKPLEVVLTASVRLTGRVTDPAGEPVAGARLLISEADPPAVDSPAARPRRAVGVDPGGSFSVELPPGLYELRAEAVGKVPSILPDLRVEAGSEGLAVDLVLEPGWTISGVVLDAERRPVPAAKVELRALDPTGDDRDPGRIVGWAESDVDGGFRIAGLTSVPGLLTADHPDHPRYERRLSAADEDRWLEIELDSGARLSGRVSTGDGEPVRGARVVAAAIDRSQELTAASDPGGGFSIAGVPPGLYRLSAEKPGFATAAPRSPVEVATHDVEEIELVLEPGARLGGQVLGVEWSQLADLRVTARGPQGEALAAMIDPEALYTVEGLGPGRWRVHAELGDGSRSETATVVIAASEREVELDLDLGDGARLTGGVWLDERPVAGAQVVITRRSGIADASESRARTSTDDRGLFSVDGLEPGHYTVAIADPASRLTDRRGVEIRGDHHLDVDLVAGEIAGRVVDAESGEPIAGATVRLVSSDPMREPAQPRTASSDAAGGFGFHRVAAGAYRVEARAPRHGEASSDVRVEATGERERVEVALDPAPGLSIEVRDALGGIPSWLDYAVVAIDGSGIVAAGSSSPDSTGVVALTEIVAGDWRLLAAAAGTAVVSVRVRASAQNPALVLPRPAALEVSVPGGDDRAAVTLTGSDGMTFAVPLGGGRWLRHWPTRGDRVTIGRLPPGVWRVLATADDGRSWSGTATTSPGAFVEVVLTPQWVGHGG